MKLTDILLPECIALNIKGTSKADVIREMAEIVVKSGKVQSVEPLVDALMARESIQTTGIGYGMAIPHATAEGVKGLVLGMGVMKDGVDFDALDNQPVQLFFVLAGEPRLQTSFLSILSKISRFFRKPEFREQVVSASSPEEIFALIQSREEQ